MLFRPVRNGKRDIFDDIYRQQSRCFGRQFSRGGGGGGFRRRHRERKRVMESRQKEFEGKLEKVRAWLARRKLGGVLLTGRGLFGWATAGGENHVTLAEEGASSLLIVPEEVVFFADVIEAPRLEAEELGGLSGGRVFSFPWHEPDAAAKELRRLIGRRRCVGDVCRWGVAPLPRDFVELTYQLMPREIVRYRRLGRDCSAAMEEALEAVRPEMTEAWIAGLIAARLYDHGVTPQLILTAADERTRRFRHPLPRARKRLRRRLMAVLCGRRGGLIVSLTRMLFCGESLPADLRRRHEAAVAVDVALNAGTRPGRSVGEIFEEARRVYAEHGFPDEWRRHHQGGPTGYQGRSYKGTTEEKQRVLERQAFAWNPSIAGTKSEDTVLSGAKEVEFLSAPSKFWPCLIVERGGRRFRRPDVKLL